MTPSSPRTKPTRIGVHLTLAGVWLLLPAVLLIPLAAVPQASPVREADASCGECHSNIYRNYLATPMANASGLATEKLQAGRFVHKPSGMEYELSVLDGKASLSYRALNQSGMWSKRTLSYFLGSGHLGTTYLYSIEDYLFESPVAWYAATQDYDMKPGLAQMQEIPPPLPMESNCLRCHMSAVQSSDPGTINRYKGLPFLHSGITCEACHGDSRQHVITKGKSSIVNPARLDADRRDSICISCHLEGDVSVEKAAQSALKYRPGESISSFMAYYVLAGVSPTARGVSEVEQFSQSTCKRVTGDRMSCTSCHDPHFTPDAQHRISFFRSKCLACHNQPEFSATHHPENQDCTSCHMRRTGAVNILHVAWTDHRILRLPENSKTGPPMQEKNELVAVFSPGATERDRAMANYKALLEGDRVFEAAAWESLKQLRESIVNDKEALNALGNLSAERGDSLTAEQSFRRVLELDPGDFTALSNLGTLLAKQGNIKDAIPLLQKAFDQNRDIPSLAKNLARVECMAGDGAAARNTLATALIYCPNLEDLRRLLTEMNARNTCGSKSD
jgi:Flp pilus assembly protein TadD